MSIQPLSASPDSYQPGIEGNRAHCEEQRNRPAVLKVQGSSPLKVLGTLRVEDQEE